MADTTALKNRIRAAIKANDNQEITGPVLQQALLDIVDELDTNPELAAEINARESADTQLQQNISAETTRAKGAESTLQQGINTERQTRIDADNALGQRITEEHQRAEDAESTLQQGINTERQARIDADNALGQRITEEHQRAEDALSYNNTLEANNSGEAVDKPYTLTDGYWGVDGITQAPGFYCTSELISVLPGIIVKVKNFFDPSTSSSSAAAYLYDKNGIAVGNRINIQDFTVQSDGSYTYTVENAAAAFIGLSTKLNSDNGSIKLILPAKINDAYKEQILLETNARLKVIEDTLDIDTKHVDLIMFMGQSNMAGRGITNASHPEAAPAVMDGAGYEFRPISDPTKLYLIAEPFGKNENKSGGIDDGNNKTGSMVSAFVNAYYKTTGKKVVGVSASKGGTRSALWLPSGILLPDAVQRLTDTITFLTTNDYIIDHKYMVWCQGESDGDNAVSADDYKTNFRTILDTMENAGIEKCFIVRIGKYNGTGSTDYTTIINAQSDLCKDNADIVMASTALASFKDKGLMKDIFHYYQDAYNIVGTYAGRNVGLYRLYGIGKPQYDVMTNSLFFTDKDY